MTETTQSLHASHEDEIYDSFVAANSGKIQCKAARHGTFNSPHDSRIIYVDPDREEPQIHSPLLTPAEAKAAFERGLIEDPANAKAVGQEDAVVENTDPNHISKVGAARTAEFAEQDEQSGLGSSTLDSRQSTAFEDRERVEGGVKGYADGVRTVDGGNAQSAPATEVDQASSDEDAPPAPAAKKPGRPPKATPSA